MTIAVFGAGAWGTAMAVHLQRRGHRVTLVPRRMEQALELSSTRENRQYLPGFELAMDMQIGCEPRPAIMEADLLLLACPSAGLRALCARIAGHAGDAWGRPLCLALCKGLDTDTLELPSTIMRQALPGWETGVLSGPSNAGEVARGKPTALVLAAEASERALEQAQHALSDRRLRLYRSGDVRGVELGGSLKNVYAIAAGASDGLGLGDNARAALLTRALAEMVRLGTAWGGARETFFGLSGFGDLVATSHGDWSRNRTFGQAIGKGSSPESLMRERATVVEGYQATRCFHELARRDGLEAPILEQVHAVLHEGAPPDEALSALMGRNLKEE
jgi:glycerol-3-phosphate dehydrogenase (NAD(P)+)